MNISKLIKNLELQKKLFPYNLNQFLSINPVNNKVLNSFNTDNQECIKNKINYSQKSFNTWKMESIDNKKVKFSELIKNLEKHKHDLATTITNEMGKPIKESLAEIDKSINHVKYYIDNGEKFLKDKELNFENYENIVSYEPLGPILNITPWNFPIWVPFKSIIPCLFAGNTIIQKPASRCPLISLKLENIFKDSGFKDIFQTCFIENERIGDELIGDFRIRGVIFTGSTSAGKSVGEYCGKYIKKSLLELGGSDPFIVFSDVVNIDEAVKQAAIGRLRNTGQSCNASKRIILHENIHDEFVEKLYSYIKDNYINSYNNIRNPLNDKATQGPLARFDLYLNLKRQVMETIENDHAIIYKSEENLDSLEVEDYKLEKGNFFKPLILLEIKPDSIPAHEEIFGPVFSIFKFKTDEEAYNLMNKSEYGLSACIFTKDLVKARDFAIKAECGMVYINSNSFSDSRLPYGGVKNSGFGRTSAKNIFYEMTNHKVISLNK